jgi:zinc transport system ATP-binding protein
MDKIENGGACKFCCTKIQNISVKFEETAVDNVSLHLHCGEITVVVGRNGAGKSTLLKAIIGDVKHQGSISFDSKHNNSKKLTIGYVPQKISIEESPMSVYDLVRTYTTDSCVLFKGNKSERKKIQKHLKEFGVDNLINKRMSSLSGGEQQRVLIAIATFPYPELLILDEPVSGVDGKGRTNFYKLLKTIKEKHDISILLVSHDFSNIQDYADKVVLLNKKILKEGTPKEVLDSKEFREEFLLGGIDKC